MENKATHSLCLKITLIKNQSSLESNATNNKNYPSKLLVVIRKNLRISDLMLQIEQNLQSMGFNHLHVQYMSTKDMFRLSPKLILNESVSNNNSDLIATYSIHYTNNINDNGDSNDTSCLHSILQDWKHNIIDSMAQCYQIMKEYDANQIENTIVNINVNENTANNMKKINMDDLLLYTICLCTTKIQNVQLQSEASQIAYSILSIIIDKHLWSSHNKTTIEFILHQLICSDYINDKQRIYLLNIGNKTVDNISDNNASNIDSFKMLTIDTDVVISKITNMNKIIKSVLHNALLSENITSNATNVFVSIMDNPMSKNILKYDNILQCCRYIISYNQSLSNIHSNKQSNLDHIAEILISKLINQLQSLLFTDAIHAKPNEKQIHQFLDLIMCNELPQHWRQFRVIITGIDIIWKYLTRIVSPSLNNGLSNVCTIIMRLRVHLIYCMFLLLENWEMNKKSEKLFQHSHFNLLEEFVLKWIKDTNDLVEFCQIISNKNIDSVIVWPIEIQKAYFSKVLLTKFLHQQHKSIDIILEIIKYIIKYPILLNDDGTAEISNDLQIKTNKMITNTTQIDFNFKKIYLQMIQKGLQKPHQKSKIISQFSGALLSRLRFATYSNEQILLLRLLCLFHKNCKNQFLKDKIIRNVKDIYEDGKLASLTTQSYVDLLLQSNLNCETSSRSMSKSVGNGL